MKRKLLFVIVAFIVAFISCEENEPLPVAVTDVTLNAASLELTEGEDAVLIATVSPENAANRNVTWSSSDATVATVNAGKVTAVKAGFATITVTTEDGGKTATCDVTVNSKVYPVESVTLDKTTLELTEGEEATLTAKVSPENATNKNVTWTSSDEEVANVDGGKVTAVKVGTATITVTTEDGGKTATCDVTVNSKVYPVESVTLDKTTLELAEGEEATLTAKVSPENATNKNVTWTSSDEEVANVDSGKVTAVKAGTATITVTTEDGGKTATCEVTVSSKVYPVESVTLDKTTLELTEGEEATLTAKVYPENATNKNVTWTSSDEAVATVKDGKVTAVKSGMAVIVVSTEDGGKTATCSVTVAAKQEEPEEPEAVPVTEVTLDKTTLELTEGDEAALTATVIPENATNKNVTWTSSDEEVANVDGGKVTAVKAGTTTVTVTTEDGGKTAICEVIVRAEVHPVESVTLDKTTLELTEGEEVTLTASVSPENAANKAVIWASSDETVATVKDGKVTAVKTGTSTITVTTDDGGKTATCKVIVNAKVYPVESVSLDKTSLELTEGEEATLTAIVNPENATNKNVIWTSSDETVATVKDGKVTAVKTGTTTITVTTDDGGKTATCAISVAAKQEDPEEPEVVSVTGVSLDKTSLELTEGEEATLTAIVNPENATNKNVIWASSDESVATVKDGKVTAVKAGMAVIVVSTEDGGKTATCSVTVTATQEDSEEPEEPEVVSVSGVTLDITSLALAVGDEFTLIATVTPDNATNKDVTWSSSDNSVVTVNEGIIKAVKTGIAVIIVSTLDGGKTATCTVNVSAEPIPITGLSIDKTSVVLKQGEEINLVVTITPDEAKYRKVIWSSSDLSVATVQDGKVKAIKSGFATIKATIDDSWWVNCYVQVIAPGSNEGIGYDEYN